MPTPSLDDVRTWPAVVSLPIAGSAFGLGRAQSYALAARDEFPVRVLTLGHRRVVPTADIIRMLEGGS